MRTKIYAVLISCIFISIVVKNIVNAQEVDSNRKPNIILLIGDDHGYPYYGFMGNEDVYTPQLDFLADGGMVFRYGFNTSSTCAPSLMSLLTGLNPIQWEKYIANKLNKNVEDLTGDEKYLNGIELIRAYNTLPRLLAEQGYVSFQGGKHWEGTYDTVGFTEGMTKDKGEKAVEKYGALLTMAGADGLALGRETMQPVYDFIDKHAEEPFFIWFAPMLPHSPFNPPEKYLTLYEGKGLSESAKKYYANCTWFDDCTGQLIRYLDDKGLRNKTVLIYFSDNGWEQNPLEEFEGNFVTSALGGRLGKGGLHEMSCRTPIIFNLQGKIEAQVTYDSLISTLDIYATILDFAGVKVPENKPGKSLKPLLELDKRDFIIGSIADIRPVEGIENPKADLFHRNAEAYYLATRKWQYIWYKSFNKEELYDKETDPEERFNIINKYPDLARRFKMEIEKWKQDMLESVSSPDNLDQ